MAVGNRWHYRSSEGDWTAPVTETWRIVEHKGHGYVLEIRQSLLADRLPSEFLSASADGVVLQPQADSPPAFIIKPPLRLGTTWETRAGRFKITGVSELTAVPAGVFENCLEVSFWAHNGQATAVTRYASGVGMVQRDEAFTVWGGPDSADPALSRLDFSEAEAWGARLGRVSLWLSEWQLAPVPPSYVRDETADQQDRPGLDQDRYVE